MARLTTASAKHAGVVKKMMPVLMDSTRGANLVKTCKGMEYYSMQKAWVGEKMKASNTRACNAVVSKRPRRSTRRHTSFVMKSCGARARVPRCQPDVFEFL